MIHDGMYFTGGRLVVVLDFMAKVGSFEIF